jgi:hypothetical protein
MTPPTPWRKSHAKKLLREEIMAKIVTADSNPKIVHESQQLYKKYPFRNFKTNIKNFIVACNNPKKQAQLLQYWSHTTPGHDTKMVPNLRSHRAPLPD